MKMRFCSNCGYPLPVNVKRCIECGAPVEPLEETPEDRGVSDSTASIRAVAAHGAHEPAAEAGESPRAEQSIPWPSAPEDPFTDEEAAADEADDILADNAPQHDGADAAASAPDAFDGEPEEQQPAEDGSGEAGLPFDANGAAEVAEPEDSYAEAVDAAGEPSESFDGPASMTDSEGAAPVSSPVAAEDLELEDEDFEEAASGAHASGQPTGYAVASEDDQPAAEPDETGSVTDAADDRPGADVSEDAVDAGAAADEVPAAAAAAVEAAGAGAAREAAADDIDAEVAFETPGDDTGVKPVSDEDGSAAAAVEGAPAADEDVPAADRLITDAERHGAHAAPAFGEELSEPEPADSETEGDRAISEESVAQDDADGEGSEATDAARASEGATEGELEGEEPADDSHPETVHEEPGETEAVAASVSAGEAVPARSDEDARTEEDAAKAAGTQQVDSADRPADSEGAADIEQPDDDAGHAASDGDAEATEPAEPRDSVSTWFADHRLFDAPEPLGVAARRAEAEKAAAAAEAAAASWAGAEHAASDEGAAAEAAPSDANGAVSAAAAGFPEPSEQRGEEASSEGETQVIASDADETQVMSPDADSAKEEASAAAGNDETQVLDDASGAAAEEGTEHTAVMPAVAADGSSDTPTDADGAASDTAEGEAAADAFTPASAKVRRVSAANTVDKPTRAQRRAAMGGAHASGNNSAVIMPEKRSKKPLVITVVAVVILAIILVVFHPWAQEGGTSAVSSSTVASQSTSSASSSSSSTKSGSSKKSTKADSNATGSLKGGNGGTGSSKKSAGSSGSKSSKSSKSSGTAASAGTSAAAQGATRQATNQNGGGTATGGAANGTGTYTGGGYNGGTATGGGTYTGGGNGGTATGTNGGGYTGGNGGTAARNTGGGTRAAGNGGVTRPASSSYSLAVTTSGGGKLYGSVRRTASGYVIADSSSRAYSMKQLRRLGLSGAELCIAWNEPYARMGAHFANPDLQRYFESCSWYRDRGLSNIALSGVAAKNVNKLHRLARETGNGGWASLASR